MLQYFRRSPYFLIFERPMRHRVTMCLPNWPNSHKSQLCSNSKCTDRIHHWSRLQLQTLKLDSELSPAYMLRFLFILQVSWMRKRDMHILSAGILMYTSDLRFQVIHPEKSENWTLQIKSPQERDSGVYECQVSTEPKMSLNYSLNVVGEWILNNSGGHTSRLARVVFHFPAKSGRFNRAILHFPSW